MSLVAEGLVLVILHINVNWLTFIVALAFFDGLLIEIFSFSEALSHLVEVVAGSAMSDYKFLSAQLQIGKGFLQVPNFHLLSYVL